MLNVRFGSIADISTQPLVNNLCMNINIPQEIYRAARNSGHYLQLLELKADYVYLISARHAYVGIWYPRLNYFVISREKFDNRYIFFEYHWDIGEPHGTVKPIKELEESKIKLSEVIKNKNLLMIEQEVQLKIMQYLDKLILKYPIKNLMIDFVEKSRFT